MARVLCVTADCGGNVAPLLGVAGELQRRGHEVRVLGGPTQAARLASGGFPVVPARHTRPFTARDGATPVDWLRTFADRGLGRDVADALAAGRPDVVVVDALLFVALDVVRRSGVPYVVLEHFPDGYYERGLVRGPAGVAMRLRGLRPRQGVDGAAARVVTTLPELDPGASVAPGMVHVGPVVDLAPVAEEREADPLVLVSLSTVAYRGMGAVLQRVVDAVAGLRTRVVVTTGRAVDPATVRAPAEVEVRRFVPHAELMPHASLLVGHGGHGTTTQALGHDLPVAVLPLDRTTDQPLVGRTVEAAGAGRTLSRRTSPERLVPVLAQLLGEGPHRAAAARLGARVRATPGARLGADAVERVLSRAPA